MYDLKTKMSVAVLHPPIADVSMWSSLIIIYLCASLSCFVS